MDIDTGNMRILIMKEHERYGVSKSFYVQHEPNGVVYSEEFQNQFCV